MDKNAELWKHYNKKYYSSTYKIFRHYYVNGMRLLFHTDPVLRYYAGKKVLSRRDTNEMISQMILNGTPFMIARFGATELHAITHYLDMKINGETEAKKEEFKSKISSLQNNAGFFPGSFEMVEHFITTYIDAAKECDMLAMWHLYMEEYMINTYMSNSKITHLLRLEPWLTTNPWSKALAGKKVLIIHPFEDTIRSQYAKREKIFADPNVLPEFELLTLKAVQTVAGNSDSRFDTWFDALQYMTDKALEMDFDIAIIGCGAYGMPLAANLKRAGKQAIHLGGATQLMFGIKGKRWEKNYPSKVAMLFNDSWVYPSENEKPKNSDKVEGSCYW